MNASPDAPNPPAAAPMDSAMTRRATTVTLGVAALLIALKAFALGASGSVAILASLADSGLDLVAALGLVFASRWAAGRTEANAQARATAVATLIQIGLVGGVAIFLAWEALDRIIAPRLITGGVWAVGVVLMAMALAAWLAWRQPRTAGSRPPSMLADLGANAVVLIGVVSGAFLGAPALDAAAGLIVAVWLVWGALGGLRPAMEQLLGRAFDDAERARVVETVLSETRIASVSHVEARHHGDAAHIRMGVQIAGDPSWSVAAEALQQGRSRLLSQWPNADIVLAPVAPADAKAAASAPSTPRPDEPFALTRPQRGPWSQ